MKVKQGVRNPVVKCEVRHFPTVISGHFSPSYPHKGLHRDMFKKYKKNQQYFCNTRKYFSGHFHLLTLSYNLSKHLKGQLEPPVSNVFGPRSIGTPRQ